MNNTFICPSDEYVMIHKSAVSKLADMLPLGEDENKAYDRFGLLMEMMEVHRISQGWKEKDHAT